MSKAALDLSTPQWDSYAPAELRRVVGLDASPDAVVGAEPSRRSVLYGRFGKRAFDLAIVLLLSPLWLPIYAIVACLILVLDGRPIHYRSTRTGQGCRPYSIYKFRTMRRDSSEVLRELLATDSAARVEYELYNKLKTDPRISRVGRFLRRASVDELPQLLNVLKGDMSLVGPRPPSTEDDTQTYYGALAPYVFADRPGLTGMWQVSERHSTPYERKVWLDLVYSSRCTFRLDLSILAKTVPTVLMGRGSF